MPKLRVVADYDCWPIWDEEGEMNQPSDYPLSQETIDRFDKWQAQYDSLLNLADPYAMGFKTSEEADAFEREGLELAQRMQAELGASYTIFYHDEPVQVPVVV
jgi:hypothetical protein